MHLVFRGGMMSGARHVALSGGIVRTAKSLSAGIVRMANGYGTSTVDLGN